MRTLITVLLGAILLLPALLSSGQEQNVLRTQATQAFNAEMAREKAGDCPDANNTLQVNVCLGKAVAMTDQNVKAYEQALRSMIASQNSAPSPTSDQRAAEFDHAEQLWREYAKAACLAVYHQFQGGTIGPSAQAECHLRLARNHLRELDANYALQLHH